MRFRAAPMMVAAVLAVLGASADRSAFAKSARFEIQDRCPCPGPTIRTFWESKAARLACVDAVIAKLLVRSCGTGKFCWSDATCDGPDAYGICVELVGVGTCEVGTGSSVCGCDGQTYPNLCTLAAAGMPLRQFSACDAE